ncbi:MAG: hypothetical protein U9R49_05520 [Bacteroidota bacterium]|nr:hypothetical protein [Bacteroidota bacterium]
MRRVLLSSFLIFFLAPAIIFAQRDSLRTVFLDAESWFLFEEYAEALPLYESLLKSDPGNDNLKYKIGICLLNDPYQKDKAIQYLLDASNNINPAYKENTLKEKTAPPDALYYLGNAYLVNELLNRAIESYQEFLEVMDHDVYDDELVKAQIQSCKNARRLLTMPVDIDLVLLDSLINTRYSDIHPVVSGDGTKLAFVTGLPFFDGAFYTEKKEDGWSYPQIITQLMGFDADVYPVALSHDGSEMILYYDDDYIGNLYSTRMQDGMWTPATKMGENISTKYWESHASFSKDGQTLYFTSNRKGTNGGLDIYMSERQADGKWGVPVNLGTTINTRYNEECPYISEDGQTLYFSSYGHYNMGGYDIFYSRKNEDGTWAEPVNIGYPINTTDDDLFFQPFDNGNAAYFSVYSPSGIGRHDIYYMTIYSANNPRLYSVSGNLRTEDGRVDSTRMAIYVIDSDSGDTLIYTSPTEEGAFAFQLKQGIYELHFTGEGYEDLIRPLQITTSSNKQGVPLEDNIELALIKEEIPEEEVELFEGEESKIKLKESHVEAVAGVPLVIPLVAPKGSTIIVRTYQDSVLISTDTIVTEKRRSELQIVPVPGNSEVELEMCDEDGNIHRNRIMVVGSTPLVKDRMEEPAAGEEGMEAKQAIDEDDDLQLAKTGSVGGAALLILPLAEQSDGALRAELLRLDSTVRIDSVSEGPVTEKELFEQLYEASASKGYDENEVDALLIDLLSDGKAALLLQQLTEQTDGALQEYLKQLDLEAEGIRSSQDLLDHLEKVARSEGFTMDEVRQAMLDSLESPLEVCRLYEELLRSSEGAAREVLESLDLRKEGVYTIEQLKERISRELELEGFSNKEIEQILGELFGDESSMAWALLALIVVAGAGLIWFIIAWWRRRKKGGKQGD